MLTGGPIVDRIWRQLLDQSGVRPGSPLTDDPDLHLAVGHQRMDPAAQSGETYHFTLPAVPSCLRIMSRAVSPQELGEARDPRSLGVARRRIIVRQGGRTRQMKPKTPA